MPKRMFMPWGKVATSVVLVGWPFGNVLHDDVGAVTDWSIDDYPTLEMYQPPNGAVILVDEDGNECLDSYCRVLEVGDDFDPWEGDVSIDTWDADICAAATRATQMHDSLKRLDWMRESLPKGFEDTTIGPVLKLVIEARIKDEIERLEAQIEAYRKARVEIEHWDERVKPPCQTCANATETRALPCDECGHMDEPGEDVEEVEHV